MGHTGEIYVWYGKTVFSIVFLAENKKSGDIVAVKRMKQKYYTWDKVKNLREVRALQMLRNVENVVKLHEVLRQDNVVFFVFEYVEQNVYQFIRNQKARSSCYFPVKFSCFQSFLFGKKCNRPNASLLLEKSLLAVSVME